MNLEWCITSRTRKAHLYIDGSDIAVCRRGNKNKGAFTIRLSSDIDDSRKCSDCRTMERRILENIDGIISVR